MGAELAQIGRKQRRIGESGASLGAAKDDETDFGRDAEANGGPDGA